MATMPTLNEETNKTANPSDTSSYSSPIGGSSRSRPRRPAHFPRRRVLSSNGESLDLRSLVDRIESLRQQKLALDKLPITERRNEAVIKQRSEQLHQQAEIVMQRLFTLEASAPTSTKLRLDARNYKAIFFGLKLHHLETKAWPFFQLFQLHCQLRWNEIKAAKEPRRHVEKSRWSEQPIIPHEAKFIPITPRLIGLILQLISLSEDHGPHVAATALEWMMNKERQQYFEVQSSHYDIVIKQFFENFKKIRLLKHTAEREASMAPAPSADYIDAESDAPIEEFDPEPYNSIIRIRAVQVKSFWMNATEAKRSPLGWILTIRMLAWADDLQSALEVYDSYRESPKVCQEVFEGKSTTATSSTSFAASSQDGSSYGQPSPSEAQQSAYNDIMALFVKRFQQSKSASSSSSTPNSSTQTPSSSSPVADPILRASLDAFLTKRPIPVRNIRKESSMLPATTPKSASQSFKSGKTKLKSGVKSPSARTNRSSGRATPKRSSKISPR